MTISQFKCPVHAYFQNVQTKFLASRLDKIFLNQLKCFKIFRNMTFLPFFKYLIIFHLRTKWKVFLKSIQTQQLNKVDSFYCRWFWICTIVLNNVYLFSNKKHQYRWWNIARSLSDTIKTKGSFVVSTAQAFGKNYQVILPNM